MNFFEKLFETINSSAVQITIRPHSLTSSFKKKIEADSDELLVCFGDKSICYKFCKDKIVKHEVVVNDALKKISTVRYFKPIYMHKSETTFISGRVNQLKIKALPEKKIELIDSNGNTLWEFELDTAYTKESLVRTNIVKIEEYYGIQIEFFNQ